MAVDGFIEKGDDIYYDMPYWNIYLESILRAQTPTYSKQYGTSTHLIKIPAIYAAINFKEFCNVLASLFDKFINDNLDKFDSEFIDYKYISILEKYRSTLHLGKVFPKQKQSVMVADYLSYYLVLSTREITEKSPEYYGYKKAIIRNRRIVYYNDYWS